MTPGQKHHLDGADHLIGYLTRAKSVIADKAYDATERMRKKLERGNCRVVIPPKRNRLSTIECDKTLYKSRHLIVNFFLN